VAPAGADDLRQYCLSQLARHEAYIVEHLEDLPEIRNWQLGAEVPAL
jgi:xylulose-5-phosphate/fructose-6-phosphate phosphoketolase